MSNLKNRLIDELDRIEEDALHSMKGHYNASARWRFWHLILGIANVIFSVIAGITAFSQLDTLIKYATIIVAILTGLTTFLECSQKAENHKTSGHSFLRIKNKARYLKEVKSEMLDEKDFETSVNELLEQKDELNSASLAIPEFAYNKAKKDIKNGDSDYKIDKERK